MARPVGVAGAVHVSCVDDDTVAAAMAVPNLVRACIEIICMYVCMYVEKGKCMYNIGICTYIYIYIHHDCVQRYTAVSQHTDTCPNT